MSTKVDNCDLKSQDEIIQSQNNKSYWSSTFPHFLACATDDFCCYIETTKNVSAASSAKASRDFVVLNGIAPHLIGLDTNDTSFSAFFDPNVIEELFSGTFVGKVSVHNKLEGLQEYMKTMATRLPSPSDVCEAAIKCIDDIKKGLDHMVLNVKCNKEIQFNDWLFDYLNGVLSPQQFIVEANKENKSIFPDVCEYSSSAADCFIYHPRSVLESRIGGINVLITNSDEEDEENLELDIKEPLDFCETLYHITATTVEIKSNTVNEAAINECFYNMGGKASKIVTEMLQLGHIVDRLTMYGIVCSMDEPRHAIFLMMNWDFQTSKTVFKKLPQNMPFVHALHWALKTLSK